MIAHTVRLFVVLLLSVPPAVADTFRLKPYKDELFSYQRIIATKYDGDLVFVEFSNERDQKQRDEIELKKVRPEYVSLDVNQHMKDLVLPGSTPVRYVGVGKTEGGAKIVVIFLHGYHGDRHLAMVDWRFGGNFNRLKNLMLLNDGAYLSPDFSNFGSKGTNEIKALIRHHAEISPGAPIILACASTSCKIIFRLLSDPEAVDLLGGAVLLGPLISGNVDDENFFTSPPYRDPGRRVPIYIGHGSQDPTVSWVTSELFFREVKAGVPDYPLRFELFMTGVHGTPIRMLDWRLVLNWMLEVNGA